MVLWVKMVYAGLGPSQMTMLYLKRSNYTLTDPTTMSFTRYL